MKHLILGTAGHIDHGKTSLVKALTGIDTDRLPEEKARGITIELGFAHLSLPGGVELGIVDVPGHERFVRTMVAGVGGMDLVMLVIAADEGIMPQTREHLEICQLLGVKKGLVALTKSDLVDAEWLDMAAEEVRDYLSGSFLEGGSVVPVSARTGAGLDRLKEELARLAVEAEEKRGTGNFRLPVDRVFTVTGFGTVVTGTLLSGEIRVGDEVEILPAAMQCRVRGVQVHGTKNDRAAAGQRVAVNLQGVDHTDVRRGDIVVQRGAYSATRTVDVRLQYLPTAPFDLRHRSTLRLHSATYEVSAQVILLDRSLVKPGEEAFAQLRLKSPVLLLPGDPFVLRTYSPQATVGGGTILDPAPHRRRRRSSEALSLLSALHGGEESERVARLIEESLLSGIPEEELAYRSGLSGKRLEAVLSELLSRGAIVQAVREPRVFLGRNAFAELKGLMLKELADYLANNPLKDGIGKEELKSRMPKRSDPRFFGPVLSALEKEGKALAARDLVKIAGEKKAGTGDGGALKGRLEAALVAGGIEPPTVRELCETTGGKEKEVLDLLHLLVREGKGVKVKADLFYAPVPLSQLKDKLTGWLKDKGEIIPGEFRELTGLSRKFMIPVLEYFDHEKITIRVGDKRMLRRS